MKLNQYCSCNVSRIKHTLPLTLSNIVVGKNKNVKVDRLEKLSRKTEIIPKEQRESIGINSGFITQHWIPDDHE